MKAYRVSSWCDGSDWGVAVLDADGRVMVSVRKGVLPDSQPFRSVRVFHDDLVRRFLEAP